MKKKELILDFTSLLDVIMILLFVVISNMNQASLSIREEADRDLSNAQTQIEELSNERDDLLGQIENSKANELNYEEINLELEELQHKYDTLQDEYDYLKITSDYDADDTSVYEAAIERMVEIVLICETDENAETGNYEVKVDVYLNDGKNTEQSFVDSVTIEHNLKLSKDERTKFNAEQVTKVTTVLSKVLRNAEHDIICFSIQYKYDDENFSNLDLEIISESIDNLERSFSKICYIKKIKLY